MKLPVSWLAEWVDFPWDASELARRLTASGFEVEGVESAAPAFSGVVVAEIVAITAHPEADKLRICQVNAGGAPLQIVCGAANARAGLKIPLAQVGAKLPGDMAIKAAKLRGVESAGMLCSAKELGLAATASGLLELPADAPVGTSIRDYLTLDDSILELKVYANRGDSMSVLGVAREIAALAGSKLKVQPAANISTSATIAAAAVQAADAAPRFLTRRITGLGNRGVTPLWMQERLRRAGLRSINPVVDVTNYVLIELGQPMHAYDARNLKGALTVRMARAGEKLQLLDERTLELAPDVLLIADDSGPIGMAGVMGGQTTSINPEATDVLLEVAYFSPDAIAGRGRRYGIQTDASQRFERGVDPQGQAAAMQRATELILSLCGGEASAVAEAVNTPALPVRPPVLLRRQRLALLTGADIADARVQQSLAGLGMQVVAHAQGWMVTPPSWRFDIAIEADLVEEVLRIVGFDAVQEVPRRMLQRFARRSEAVIDERALLDALTARGYQEAINYAFVDPSLQQRLFPEQAALRLNNPITADLAVMRVSLWPGLLKVVMENLSRQQDRVRLFERGTVFLQQSGTVHEALRVAGVATGARSPEQWAAGRETVDFFDIKSDFSAVLAMAGGGAKFEWQPARLACLHPGRSASVVRDGQEIGWLGELHPSVAAGLGLSAPCMLFELDLTVALQAPLPVLAPISRFPQVRRDLSITVPADTPLSAILSRVSVAAGSQLRDLRVFDLYQGAGIEPTRKSIALGLIFQDNTKTLTDDDADGLMASVAADLGAELDARIRK
ncbi:MAG: phenylalanine--tRNA ligase subunit beta [Pseudomonadota bacterium]